MVDISHGNRREITTVPPIRSGLELRPILELLGAWDHRWARSNLNKGDLHAGLFMWDMRRTADPAVFPTRRIVVQFEYPDGLLPSG